MAGTAANGKEWARANPAKVEDFGDKDLLQIAKARGAA
jgi:hypothetical protein